MLRGPDAFQDVALALVHAVAAQLDAAGTGVPDRAGVVPGAIAWDACDCGQLAVALTGTWASESPPAAAAEGAATSMMPCGPAYVVGAYVVQVARCAPTLDDAGNPPSVEAEEQAAAQLTGDAYAVRAGVRCALEPLRRADDIAGWQARAVTVQGPEGGCVGIELAVTAWVLNDCPECNGA